nr:hypothetical protein [Tanacetum cinerariifolium]
AATDDSPTIPEHTTVETPMNMSPTNKAYFKAEKEAIHLILTRIGDEIYSTIDACQTAQEMWEAIERYKGKEIAKPTTPPSETASEEDIDHEQAQRDKDMQKNLALIEMYLKKIYKPTNNNLRTSSNSRNKNVDTTLRYNNDNHLGFNVLSARNLDILLRNAENQKGLKTLDTDDKINERELEAHYSYMAKIHKVPTADTCTDSEPLERVQNDARYNMFANYLTCLVETNDRNVIPDSPDMCDDDIQNDQDDVESDDERVALANLIANLKLNVDENKKIQKQLKKANTTLAQELKECKTILAKTNALAELQCLYLHKVKECDCLAQKLSKQTESVSKEVYTELLQRFAKVEKHLISLKISLQKYLKAQLQDKNIAISELKKLIEKGKGKFVDTKFDNPSVVRQPNTQRIPKPSVLGVNHQTNVSRPQHRSNQIKDKVVPNNSQDMDILIKTCLMPLALKTQNDSFIFVHELKQEMHADLKYVESIEKEIDELESDKAEFSNMYAMILQECVSNEVMCTYLLSLSDLDALAELQCLYLHKVKECDCLA